MNLPRFSVFAKCQLNLLSEFNEQIYTILRVVASSDDDA